MPTLRVDLMEGRTVRRTLIAFAAIAAASALAGCASMENWKMPWKWPPYGMRAQAAASCNVAPVQSLVGQKVSDAIVQKAKADAGATVVRVVRHDQMVTKEFLAGRLNLRLDANGTIAEVTCG